MPNRYFKNVTISGLFFDQFKEFSRLKIINNLIQFRYKNSSTIAVV